MFESFRIWLLTGCISSLRSRTRGGAETQGHPLGLDCPRQPEPRVPCPVSPHPARPGPSSPVQHSPEAEDAQVPGGGVEQAGLGGPEQQARPAAGQVAAAAQARPAAGHVRWGGSGGGGWGPGGPGRSVVCEAVKDVRSTPCKVARWPWGTLVKLNNNSKLHNNNRPSTSRLNRSKTCTCCSRTRLTSTNSKCNTFTSCKRSTG